LYYGGTRYFFGRKQGDSESWSEERHFWKEGDSSDSESVSSELTSLLKIISESSSSAAVITAGSCSFGYSIYVKMWSESSVSMRPHIRQLSAWKCDSTAHAVVIYFGCQPDWSPEGF